MLKNSYVFLLKSHENQTNILSNTWNAESHDFYA